MAKAFDCALFCTWAGLLPILRAFLCVLGSNKSDFRPDSLQRTGSDFDPLAVYWETHNCKRPLLTDRFKLHFCPVSLEPLSDSPVPTAKIDCYLSTNQDGIW
jgi:hypothetical protein